MKSAEKLVIVCFLFKGVLCREFSISLPESVEAVRGLCVLIPCSFEIEEQYDGDLQTDPTGIWLKDGTDPNNNRVFNSKVTEENKIEGEIIGDLRMKNCTTVFYNIRKNYSGDYYFRLETSGKLKWNYKSPSVSVRVGASPITPSITLYKEDQGEVEDQNEVVEGTSVSLICSAPAPPCLLKPPTFTWNFLPEERRQEQNHNTSVSSSQLNFNATHLHHGLNFTCTATYQLQNRNKSAQSSFILHVLYAPQISPSSRCNFIQDFFNSSCEVHGNPSPKLEWRLSGQIVRPSEFISTSESASNTTLRSFVSIRTSLNGSLQCVGSNKLGVASQIFSCMKVDHCSAAKGSGVDISSVLTGAAVGASVMMMLCGVFLCARKTQNKPPTRREDASENVLNDGKAEVEVEVEDEESVYANKTVLSESLHYSTVVFPRGDGGEIRGLSKLTADYAIIHHSSEHQTEGGVTEPTIEEDQEENGTKTNSEKKQEEEVTYGNITRQPTMEQTQLADDDDDDDEIKYIKETKEAKERDKEQHKHSEEAEGLYAQIQPNKHEQKV
ncbi:sialic acid-binding Ig-like lectin 13 [Ictalurus furcatus]|uniref:sialic acid-binding Ig-like lectin 13 n=1 Tax=Ictalurus furcatus TaxID=66913 RepID=UPI0023501EB0|nr:sialic acid-binding Ig-like lectin 13 [Ictalurus furcatus]XP_053506609.1 sialic acid-binding Ig-like lectin 13 [Ictalurus furcatus]